MKELNFISPFKKLCITIGNLPTAYIESMSYYEGLTFLVNYLANNVIPAVNNNSEVVKELQDQFVILKSYVDNYFDNLDVQEEINTKLDEMVEDGTMESLLEHMYKFNYNYINLEDYFSDDLTFQQSLEAALTECNDLNKNLVIPYGEYTLSSSVNINDTKIDGNNSKITIDTDNLTYCFTGNNIDIKNLEIDLDNKCYSFIENKHYDYINLENIKVSKGKTTVSGSGFSQNGGIYLDALNVKLNNVDSSDNLGHGIIIDPSESDSIYDLNNLVANNNGNGTANISHGLLNISRTNGVNYKKLSIENSNFDGNNYSGLHIGQAQNSMVNNCTANSNGEHGVVYMDGKNATICNSQMYNNTACGIRIQGDFSYDYELTGYENITITNCIINGTHGIGISNNVNKAIMTNNIINVTGYTIYVTQSASDKLPCKNIIAKDNYLYSTEAIVGSDFVAYGPIENLNIENYCDGVKSYRTRYYSNGAFLDYPPLYIGNPDNIITDPTDMLSANWSKHGTVVDDLVYANSGGYYLGQTITAGANTDYISFKLKIDPTLSTEEQLGVFIELLDNSNVSLATLINKKYQNAYDELSAVIKISDITNVTNYAKIRIRIIGIYGKYIKPVYCYMNQSNCITLNN